MQIHFTLDDEADEALIAWWLSLPKGVRSETMRRMMRWYSGRQGFGELIDAVERFTKSGIAVPEPITPVPVFPNPPNTAELMNDAMAQFGFDDD